MAIIKNNNFSGSVGACIYQQTMGKTVVREKPAHYHDRKSKEQCVQRNKLTRVTKLYGLLKNVVSRYFESQELPTRDYDRFKKLNMNSDVIIVSEGTLPTLEYKWDNGVLSFEMKEKDWEPLDTLRLISASISDGHATCIDTIINSPKDGTFYSQPLPEGYHAFVHLREKNGKRMASTQYLDNYPKQAPGIP